MSSSVFSLGNLLKNFSFVYFPWTDWRRFISPTIVFGEANLGDAPTEQAVVDAVGSYGFQLNRVLDALAVLIRLDVTSRPLTEIERRALDRLLDLAEAAEDAAKSEYRSR